MTMHEVSGRRVARRGGVVTAAAVVAAILAWALGRVVLGHSPDAGDTRVGVGQVVAVTAVVGAAGWVVFALLACRGAVGRRRWRVLGVGVAVVSLLGPLTQAHGGSAVALVGVHVVVAVMLILGFDRWAR